EQARSLTIATTVAEKVRGFREESGAWDQTRRCQHPAGHQIGEASWQAIDIMRHGSEVGLGEKSLEGVCAGISALRHRIAGDCFQFVSGIFPHFASRGWFCLQLAWPQNRLARSHS